MVWLDAWHMQLTYSLAMTIYKSIVKVAEIEWVVNRSHMSFSSLDLTEICESLQAAWLLTRVTVPETKGRSLEDWPTTWNHITRSLNRVLKNCNALLHWALHRKALGMQWWIFLIQKKALLTPTLSPGDPRGGLPRPSLQARNWRMFLSRCGWKSQHDRRTSIFEARSLLGIEPEPDAAGWYRSATLDSSLGYDLEILGYHKALSKADRLASWIGTSSGILVPAEKAFRVCGSSWPASKHKGGHKGQSTCFCHPRKHYFAHCRTCLCDGKAIPSPKKEK